MKQSKRNRDRAKAFQAALDAYCTARDVQLEDFDDTLDAVSDLLTNLRHWLDWKDQDSSYAMNLLQGRTFWHWEAERRSNPDS